ncbi:TPA: hypothetical protein ACPJ1I_004440 [Vibrio diabolicus]
MANYIANPEDLEYTVLSPTEAVAVIESDICEMKVYRYKAGFEAPRHRHSHDTVKFVLKGKIVVDGEKEVLAGAKYACGSADGDIYYFTAPVDTYLLLLQKPGTERVID